jgi:hypothetical protein
MEAGHRLVAKRESEKRKMDSPIHRRSVGRTARGGTLAMLGALGALWASAPVASAATTVCTGTLSNTTAGAVSVPAGATCNISHSSVGNVTVAAGATLEVYNRSTISGTLITTGASDVEVYGNSTVTGAVTINLGPGGYGEVNDATVGGALTINGGQNSEVLHSHIGGAATIENQNGGGCTYYYYCTYVEVGNSTFAGPLTVTNNGSPIDVYDNHVGGRLSITGNTGGTIFFDGIYNNAVAGLLSCSANGMPFNGGGNSASVKTGQCSAF